MAAPLRGRMLRFVELLLLQPDLNQTEACRQAGYSAKAAKVQASMLMADERVIAALAASKAERKERVQVEQDEVLRELIGLVRSNVQHFSVDEQGNITLAAEAPAEAWAAISSVKRRIRHISNGPDRDPDIEYECEFKLWPKDRAIDMALQHLGIAGSRKMELTGKDGVPLPPTSIEVILVPARGKKRRAG
jgi:phage terminase small subunit